MKHLQRSFLCTAAIAALVAFDIWEFQVNATTAALYLLLVVLAVAAQWGLPESIYTSIVGVLTFNYFFLPPLHTFTISDPENLVALFAFLVTAVVASQLSATARRRAIEALARRNEIGRLYELSRALLMDEGQDAVRHSVMQARQVLRIPEIAFFDAAANQVYGSVTESLVSQAEMEQVAHTGDSILRTPVAVVPVRLGAHIVGSLATISPTLSADVRDSVASLLAINYERAHALQRAATAEIAKRNEEFRSSLLDGLAHDLKTPLTAIRTCVTHMISAPPRNEEVRQELLSIIDQESQRLQRTITEAIELARIESYELRLEKETVRVSSLIESALADVRDENRSRYNVEGPFELEAEFDSTLMRRALLQVLENAKKYSPPQSPIRVDFAADAAGIRIAVLDAGPGFKADELERVFEKFYRGRRQQNQVEGTGMGLAIARAIIEAHGGKIVAQNRMGGGAAIVMTLPFPAQ